MGYFHPWYIVRGIIGARGKTIGGKFHNRLWWFGEWRLVKLVMGPPEIFWSQGVEDDLAEIVRRTETEQRG